MATKKKKKVIKKKKKVTKKKQIKRKVVKKKLTKIIKRKVTKKVVKRKVVKKKPSKVIKKKKRKVFTRKVKPSFPTKTPKKPISEFLPPKKRVPVNIRVVGDAEGFSDVLSNEASFETFMTSSHGNRLAPTEDRLNKVFTKMLEGALRKGPFEWDEVNIYRHGVILRPRRGELPESLLNKVGEIVAEIPGAVVHAVKEEGTFSLRISFGSPTEPINGLEARNSLSDNSKTIRKVYDTMYEYFGDDIDWFDFVDTDEDLY